MRMFLWNWKTGKKLNKLVKTKMRVFNYTILSANEPLDPTMFVLLFFRSFTDKILNSYVAK